MALCGNGVVEEGEECDCGWEEDCEEECCWPQRTGYPKGQKPCTLRPQKLCSPTQVNKGYACFHFESILLFLGKSYFYLKKTYDFLHF